MRSCAPHGRPPSNCRGFVRRGFAYRVRCKGVRTYLGSRPQSNVGRGGGGNVGVNEDSLWIGKGRLAQSNAEQVKMDCQILEGLGLEIAKPDAARDILALKGPNNVPF